MSKIPSRHKDNTYWKDTFKGDLKIVQMDCISLVTSPELVRFPLIRVTPLQCSFLLSAGRAQSHPLFNS